MTNNYFTENSFLSAVGNLMKSWIHGNKAFSILALLPLFTISTRLSFCRTSIGRRLNLTENFFAQVYIACQILWISLLILPFTGTAHLNDIFDLSYKAIFILFVWDYRCSCCKAATVQVLPALFSTWGATSPGSRSDSGR